MTQKKIIVLGAGVIGLTSAYYLAKEGYTVEVVESADQPAQGASGSNGYQLAYSYLAPPFTFGDIAGRLWGMTFGTDPKKTTAHVKRSEFFRHSHWFAKALWQAAPWNYRRNFRKILQLGQLSQFLMEAFICSDDGKEVDFNFSADGKLVVFEDKTKLMHDWFATSFMTAETGWPAKKLSAQDCAKLAPFLETTRPAIAGGIYSENNHAGDCPAYCHGLAKLLAEKYQVTFTYNAPHAPIRAYTKEADAVVVACGINTNQTIKRLGLKLPIYPVKGYSYNFKKIAPQNAYVTHKAKGLVISDMGETSRVSGFADFVGLDTSEDAPRQKALLHKVQELFPNQKLKVIDQQVGYRPMTPSGLPIVRQTRHKKVFLNVGHGMYGWTLAHATSSQLADLIKKSI